MACRRRINGATRSGLRTGDATTHTQAYRQTAPPRSRVKKQCPPTLAHARARVSLSACLKGLLTAYIPSALGL
jgi:hypothetical protein